MKAILHAMGMAVVCMLLTAAARGDDGLFDGHENWPTHRQFVAKALEHAKETDHAVFHKLHHEAAWYDSAVQFLEGCVRHRWDAIDAPQKQAIERLGRNVFLDGCDDPFFRARLAGVLMDIGRSEAARAMLEPAIDQLPAQGYSALVQAWAHMTVWRIHSKRYGGDHEKRANQALTRLVATADALLRPHPTSPHHRAVLTAEIAPLIDDMPAGAAEQFADALKRATDADPVALQTALGVYHTDAAWRERGSGFANTVTPKGWLGFEEHLTRASAYFNGAYQLDPTVPEAATHMIRVSLGVGDPQDRIVWFRRAIEARFDTRTPYFRVMVAALPRWGGSHRLMLALGEAARQTQRFDTDVPGIFLHALKEISLDIGGDYALWENPEVFAKVRETVEKLVAATPEARRNTEYLTILAAAAYRNGEFDLARRTIDRLGDRYDEDAIGAMSLFWDDMVDEVYAMTGEVGPTVREAREALKQHEHEKAIGLLAQAAAAAGDDARAGRYLRHAVTTARWEQAYRRGEWVPLQFEKGLPGWSVRAGQWRVDDQGRATCLATDGIILRCRMPVGADWELKGRIDFVYREGYTNAGVFFKHKEDYAWHAFAMIPSRKHAVVQYMWPRNEDRPAPIGDENTVHIKVLDGHVTYAINDQVIYDRAPIPRFYDAHAGSMLGLGAFRPDANNELRFSELKVRRLSSD